ncbi:UAP56-interacting factor-like [Poeciliopsis prolifica]|uniref:UAP56-interacting factor-like n=1 Tax=Poeciliopsis prolifica TaxID=188132 RepID=UPI0024134E77|nr:UAP56-interacting factor-like [Poeciliopsis prolifica]
MHLKLVAIRQLKNRKRKKKKKKKKGGVPAGGDSTVVAELQKPAEPSAGCRSISGAMENGGFSTRRREMAAVPDKVDMSLDDIIRLNKKEKQLIRRQANGSRRTFKKKGLLSQSRSGAAAQRGGGAPRGGAAVLRNRRVPPLVGRRRGQGVITGLAARRPAVLLKRAGVLNRSAASQKARPRTRPFTQRSEAQYRRPRGPYRQPDQQRGQNSAALLSFRRPFQLRRRAPPPVQQTQREARQATFLFRRGLKVQAQIQKANLHTPPVRTRQWRTPTAGSGILTVSIDNPTARTQPEPPTAWTLHPTPVVLAPVKVETEEKKVPKGVPLQFDINSVGKPQTSMTLNERFRILKDRRVATAQSSRGSRFVTVG